MKKQYIYDVIIALFLCAVVVLGIFRQEQFFFVFCFVASIGFSVIQILNKNNVRKHIITGVLSCIVLIVLVVAWKDYAIWYSDESKWFFVSRIITILMLLWLVRTILKKPDENISTNLILKWIRTIGLFLVSAFYQAAVLHFTMDYSKSVSNKGLFSDFKTCMMLLLLLFMLIGNSKVTCAALDGIVSLFSVVNFFVYEFRGKPILYNDFFAAGTAKEVAGGYSFKITGEVTIVLVSLAAIFLLLIYDRHDCINIKLKLKTVCIRIAICIVSILYFVSISKVNVNDTNDISKLSGIVWNPVESYEKDGVIKTILESRNCMILHKPSGYSAEQLDEVAKQYDDETDVAIEKPHNIIVIMNESWADLSKVHSFEVNQPYNVFYNTIEGNVIKGDTLASVWGGGTCNSEYEFLTGNSMFYTPGTYPYETFVNGSVPSIVSTLKSQGYHTCAIHPAKKSNWNRDVVYDYMGFDEMHFDEIIDDCGLADYLERDILSDNGVYAFIEETLDNSPETYNFVFAVTIQNHGGYGYEAYENAVQCTSEDTYELDQYLSLLKESDDALRSLIEYYKDKESTMIVMFGDHMPYIQDVLVQSWAQEYIQSDELIDNQTVYQTPYIIWKNYGDQTQTITKNTSMNFLGSMMLKEAGLDMPVYNKFLLELSNDVQAMNVMGYQDKQGVYHTYDSMSEELSSRIDLYKMMIYKTLRNPEEVKEVFYLNNESEGK